MAENRYEIDAMKMIEEITTNAEQTKDKLLGEILERNAGTEYLSRYINGKTDKELFKKNVPVVTYEDIKPYIYRIANGETSNILTGKPVIQFHLSSGTSGAMPKMIPVTPEIRDLGTIYFDLVTSVLKKHFGDFDQEGKRLEFMFAKQDDETPSGLKARSVSASLYKEDGFRIIISKNYTSPIEAIFCPDTRQSMYCQLLIGLIKRDEVVSVASAFATALLRAIKFLEDYWMELCSNIRSGQLSDWITDSGCRNAVSSTLKPNPELAKSIQDICSCKSWEGLIRKLWPRAKFIRSIATDVMSQYVETLKFYSGGIPLVSGMYASSEFFDGINLEPGNEPPNVSYTLLPNMAYFEFLPLNKDNLTMSEEGIEPVDLVHVKLDQHYALLVTSYAGFHNSTPQFQFVQRQNVILSIDIDKTSEEDLLKAVTEAKTLLEQLGFILRGYTSYADTSSIPGHYVIFWELKAKEDKDSQELDPKIMEDCCYRMEESFGYIYRMCRNQNIVAALEIRVVEEGSFDALMDFSVSRGTSMAQYKTPSCINSKEAFNILDSNVTAKFFSPQKPIA
ncbi:hypothetical protein V6N12_054246 [Hibiscus sabdariffa]|uniref:Indole-3-acetic acid-amido synthetase GH3.17-like n=1 Tax=Hibiscus sabdariffa TaxID=183260 RepID=A0ABR2CZX8_9ROSI